MIPKQIVFVGFGAVAKALFALIPVKEPGLLQVPILIIEPQRLTECKLLKNHRYIDLRVLPFSITPHNISAIFNQYVQNEALMFDLSTRVSTIEMLRQCERKSCIYINTAIDHWERAQKDWTMENMAKNALIHLKEEILRQCVDHSTTAVLNHGMNPGLVSHFAKYAIQQEYLQMIYNQDLDKNGDSKPQITETPDYSEMAELTGLSVIHISERDTQKTRLQVKEDYFLNTWSVVGYFDEAIDPVQVSWGSHEAYRPEISDLSVIDKGQIILPYRGCQMKMKSYEPMGGMLTGYVIPHAECYSLAKFLNTPSHRISSYYVYQIPDVAKISTHYMETLKDKFDYKVLTSKDIKEGYDSVGCLMMFENSTKWIGAVQHNERALKLSSEINGTCLQVAISVLAAAMWSINNPKQGILEPEETDIQFILNYCNYWMGDLVYKDVTEETKELSNQFHDLLVHPKSDSISWTNGQEF